MRATASARRDRRVLATCWALLLVTSAIALASVGTAAPPGDPMTVSSTGTDLASVAAIDGLAVSNHTVDGACVWENTAQGDYRQHFDVTCPTSTRERGSVQFDMQGGWAYVITIEIPDGVDNATAKVRTDYPATDPKEITDHSSVPPEDITTHRGKAILRPVEALGNSLDGNPRVFRAEAQKFWNTELDPGDREVSVVAAGYTKATGGDSGFVVYPERPLSATFELPPGVYDFQVRAYRHQTMSSDAYADAATDQWVVTDGAPTASGSFSVGVGDCTPRFAASPKLEELSVRTDEAGADVETAQRAFRQRGSGGGAGRAAAAARTGDADASDSSGGPITAGLPNVSLKRTYEGPNGNANDRQPDVEQKREDSAALNPLARTKRALEERVTASQRLADSIAPASDRQAAAEREYAETMREVRRCHGGGYVPPTPTQDGSQEEEETYTADIDARTARQTVADSLRERGFEPPQGSGMTMEDYVWTKVTQGSRGGTVTGTREAYIRVGPDGNLLPNPQTLARQRKLGDVETGTLEGASHVLNVEMYRYPDGEHDATVRFVEVETGLIQNQRQAEGGTGDSGLSNAIGDGLDRLQIDLADPTDGRSSGKTIELYDGDGSGGSGASGGNGGGGQ